MPQMSAMSIVNRTVLTMVSGSRAIIQYLTWNLPVYHKTFAQNNHSANKISTLNTISLHISEPQPIHTSFYSTLCGIKLSVIPSNNKNIYLYNEYTDLDAMEKLPLGAISLRPTIPRHYKIILRLKIRLKSRSCHVHEFYRLLNGILNVVR